MKKIYLTLFAAILFCSTSFSQTVNYYIFSAASGATLDPMTGATTIVPANSTVSSVQTIPFTFLYDGKSFTQFSVSVQGFIKMGGTAALANPYNNTYSARNMIYPFWSNLTTGTNGMVSFVITGSAPNRILKIQWFVTIPRSTSGNANSTMQAWLYEGTNVIEFRYGAAGTPTIGSSVGMTGGQGDRFVSVTTSSNTASTSNANDNNLIWPGSGKLYQFTPPAVPACDRPATQPTSLRLPDRTSTFIGGYFNKASGPAAGYLVLSSRGNLTATPVDGQDYTSGDSIGNGIVSQSADSVTLSFTASNLMGNTNYTISIFSYNIGKCSGGPIYNTSFPLTGTATTCTAAPSPTAANIAPTTALIKWTSVKGGGVLVVNYTIDVATDNSFASPIAGSPFTANEPDTSVNIPGLTENTTYYYRVKATGTCTTIKTFNFTTPCSPTSIQYVQNFDGVSPPSLPACNRVEDLRGNTTWTTSAAPKGYTGNVAQFTYSNYQYADDWLYTQGINLTGGTAYTIGYKYGNDSILNTIGQTESLDVNYGTSPLSTSMTNTLISHPNFAYRTPQIDTVKFTPATTGTYYFGFHAYDFVFSQNPNYIYLDSIVIKQTGAVLPITLMAFNAKRNGLVNEIAWLTAQEKNTSLFVIERSSDGQNYQKIGEVNAAGNSSNSLSYNFTDVSPLPGTNYYRLKIIDRDNNTKFSDVKIIKNAAVSNFTIYPNPVKDVMNIDINATKAEKGVIIITGIDGRQVYNRAVNISKGSNILNINVSDIEAGTYIIKIQLSDYMMVNKITKL